MKRVHRRAHLLLWLLVGPVALLVLWRALAARPPLPVQAVSGTIQAADPAPAPAVPDAAPAADDDR